MVITGRGHRCEADRHGLPSPRRGCQQHPPLVATFLVRVSVLLQMAPAHVWVGRKALVGVATLVVLLRLLLVLGALDEDSQLLSGNKNKKKSSRQPGRRVVTQETTKYSGKVIRTRQSACVLTTRCR